MYGMYNCVYVSKHMFTGIQCMKSVLKRSHYSVARVMTFLNHLLNDSSVIAFLSVNSSIASISFLMVALCTQPTIRNEHGKGMTTQSLHSLQEYEHQM